MKEVSEEELKEVLGSFQKDKSPGTDGWTIEFFLDLFEILEGPLAGFQRFKVSRLAPG